MRRLVALLLPGVILFQACASSGPPLPMTSLDPVPLAAVNRAIEGEPVQLQLANGEVIREAEDVEMTAESTSWTKDDHKRTVPTAEVCKVIRQIRHRAGKGYAWGLVACAPGALASGSGTKDPLAALGNLLIFEGLCPFIGMFVFAALKQPPDRVVYSAPGSCGPAR
jgi:hypothetical protein